MLVNLLIVVWLVSGAMAAAYEIGRPGTKEVGYRRFIFTGLCLLMFLPLFLVVAPFGLLRRCLS
jgi:hypothetical protein